MERLLQLPFVALVFAGVAVSAGVTLVADGRPEAVIELGDNPTKAAQLGPSSCSTRAAHHGCDAPDRQGLRAAGRDREDQDRRDRTGSPANGWSSDLPGTTS